MSRFLTSRVARFVAKMRPDTIAVLCCLLLVTLGIGHSIVTSGVVSKVVDRLGDVFDSLYWQVNYAYWDFCYEYSNNGLPTYLRVLALFMICAFTPRVLGEFLHWLDLFPKAYQKHAEELADKGESPNTRKPTTPIVAPIALPPPLPVPPSYPPPFQFPFKNFRGTGESYAHPGRKGPMQYPIF
jgi:hypothetical protein